MIRKGVTSTSSYPKRENRKDIKQRESAADAKRRNNEATKTLEGMTKTALSVIHVIMAGKARSFGE
jgi:hypothetical protein